jgi:hypothetical protein
MLSVAGLLQFTWELYRKNLQVFLGYSAWILIPYIFIIIIKMAPMGTASSEIAINILLIIQAITAAWITIVITVVTSSIARKKQIKLSRLGRKAISRMLHVIVVTILSSLVTIGGTILLVIPGFIFCIWYSFALQEVILRAKRGWNAMRESRELVKGRFWGVAWRILGGEFFISLCYIFIISIVISAISAIAGIPEPSIGITEVPLWTDVLINIAEMFMLPMFIIYHTLLYINARETFKKQTV